MPMIAHLARKPEHDSTAVERNDEKLTRVARATAKARADVAREGAELAQSTADTRKLAEESPEFGRAFTDLLGEQTRQGVDTLSAFARAVNWTDVAQAQNKLIADSFLRISQFNARYSELVLRAMTATPLSPRR